MNKRNWISDKADFGARGAQYGIGLGHMDAQMGDSMFATPGDEAVAIAEQAAADAQEQSDALASQIKVLAGQLDAAQSQGTQAAANIAYSLQSQIQDLQSQLSNQQSVAAAAKSNVSSVMAQFGITSKNAPYYVIGGIAAIIILAMVMRK